MKAARFWLPLLVLISGFCGISYEILYAKLLGNLLGSQFTINATVLLTFLAGIGCGTLYAHRFVRWLWAIEAGIGLYAAAMALAYDSIDRLLYASAPLLGTSLAASALVALLLLAPPAFLVGCSVPLFAAWLSTLHLRNVFSVTYGIYNVGAAMTALGMEFVLLHRVGLRAATLWLAALNGVAALGLFLLARRASIVPTPRADRLFFDRRVLGALALASVASAIFQLLVIKLAEFVIGPYNETFALVLTTVLVGLALGSLVAGRLGFGGALLLALAGLVMLLAGYSTFAATHALLFERAVAWYPHLVLLKLGFVFALALVPAVGFGATIPALLSVHRDVARESGQLLFVSSLSNAVGFLLMAFVLHPWLDYGPLVIVIAGLTTAALVLRPAGARGVAWAGAALFALAIVALVGPWNESMLYYGHHIFRTPASLAATRKSDFSFERFKGRQDVLAVTSKNDAKFFFIDGHVSIALTSVGEKVAGALSVMTAPRRDQALVLGVGSGATAGTVGLLFDHTDAIDINPVIVENLPRIAEYNFNLTEQESVDINLIDGIRYLKTTPRKYSLVVNTVDSPLCFSSSKLYTREFLQLVLDRLTPDGVYTTWVDQDMGDRGVDIILESLDEAFDECWLAYLKSSYYLLICSNAPIAPHQFAAVVDQPDLRRYLAERENLPLRLLPYSVISTDVLGIPRDPLTPVNTRDFRTLDHAMAQSRRSQISDFNGRLAASLDLRDTARTLGIDWNPAEFLLWRRLRESSSATLSGVLEESLAREFGELGESWATAVSAAARDVDTVRGYSKFADRLYDDEHYAEAAELLERALRLDPGSASVRYDLGRNLERLGQRDRAIEQYRAILAVDPQFTPAREALERLGAATAPPAAAS